MPKARTVLPLRAFLCPEKTLADIDINTLISFGSLLVGMGSLLLMVHIQGKGNAKVMGVVSTRLTHNEQHNIRQDGRLDEHARMLRDHDREIATLKANQKHKAADGQS